MRDVTGPVSRRAAAAVGAVLLAAVLAAVLALAVGSGPAAAHAVLVETTPKDGATLETEPETVEFQFNQNIGTPAYVVVTGPDGSRIESGDPQVVDETVSQEVDNSGLAGEYEASYRVVSADGHPVKGTITYDVTSGQKPDTSAAATDGDSGSGDDESFWQEHGTAVMLGAGGVIVAAALLFWPRRKRDG